MSKPKPSWKIRRRGKSWQVDFGVVAGRRLQRSCKSNAEAQQWAQAKDNELKNKRYAALELSDQHRFDALEAYKTLARSLHVAVKSLPSPIVSLNRIAEFYIKHANPEGGQRTVQEVVDEYLQTKIASGRRPRTITDVSSRITRFAQSCSDAPINLITTVDLEKWLNSHKYKGITRKNYRTHLVMFFNFARRRKYVSVNPAEDIETPIVDEKMPEIFTVDECQTLMAANQWGSPRSGLLQMTCGHHARDKGAGQPPAKGYHEACRRGAGGSPKCVRVTPAWECFGRRFPLLPGYSPG